MKTPECIADVKNTLGEGPVWDEVTESLYWLDITERALFRFIPSSGDVTSWETPSEFGSFAFRRNGQGLVAAAKDGIVLFDPETGRYERLIALEECLTENRMNDGKCDAMGRFWCGSIHEVSDPSLRKPIASVYRVDADLTVKRVLEGIKTSNGFAWSPDGRSMYFADTPTQAINVFDYDIETGEISNRRMFAEVPSSTGRPDGAAVDAEGCLWSAHFAGGRVTRYAPNGSIVDVIELPVTNVTSCAFGGTGFSTLFITTAREDLSPEDLEREPKAGGLFSIDLDVGGFKMHRFGG